MNVMSLFKNAFIPFLLLLLMATSACLSFPKASIHYKKHRDYRSLKLLTRSLYQGMPKLRVLELLGPPSYSPTEGIDYYQSDKSVKEKPGVPPLQKVLVLSYQVKDRECCDYVVSESLQDFQLMTVGE